MAKNHKYWKSFAATEEDKKLASTGTDPLEEGLKDLGWFANSKRIVSQKIKKTRESFGEEVGNSVVSGVLALFVLGLIPFASVYSYLHAPENMALIDSLSVSIFLVTMFMASLITTIYHCMKHGTPQKRVLGKLDHIMCYYAIFGVYAPVCLSLVGGKLGIGILIAEGVLAIAGTLLMALGYPENKFVSKLAILDYGVMGILFVFMFKSFKVAATPISFWLLFAGLCVYIVGLFFYSGKKFKFSHMVWHLLVLGASVCHILALVYFFR